MGSRVAEVLNFVNTADELAPVRHYVKVIEEVAVGKQLRQVGEVFMKFIRDKVGSIC